MNADELLNALGGYTDEVTKIIERFSDHHIKTADNIRLNGIVLELRDLFDDEIIDGQRHSNEIIHAFNDANNNMYRRASSAGTNRILQVIRAAIERISRNPNCLKSTMQATVNQNTSSDALYTIAGRFHRVAQQIRKRHKNRDTLDVNDEYDVQDLMHALLKVSYNLIVPEDYSPEYAGSSSRVDFILPEIGTGVEVKMTRKGLSDKKLGEELIIDIARYNKHPDVKTLFCFVYDPSGYLRNPDKIEADLSQNPDDGLNVIVMIVPTQD